MPALSTHALSQTREGTPCNHEFPLRHAINCLFSAMAFVAAHLFSTAPRNHMAKPSLTSLSMLPLTLGGHRMDLEDAIVIFAKATRTRFGTGTMKRIQRGIDEFRQRGDEEGVLLWEKVRSLISKMEKPPE